MRTDCKPTLDCLVLLLSRAHTLGTGAPWIIPLIFLSPQKRRAQSWLPSHAPRGRETTTHGRYLSHVSYTPPLHTHTHTHTLPCRENDKTAAMAATAATFLRPLSLEPSPWLSRQQQQHQQQEPMRQQPRGEDPPPPLPQRTTGG